MTKVKISFFSETFNTADPTHTHLCTYNVENVMTKMYQKDCDTSKQCENNRKN